MMMKQISIEVNSSCYYLRSSINSLESQHTSTRIKSSTWDSFSRAGFPSRSFIFSASLLEQGQLPLSHDHKTNVIIMKEGKKKFFPTHWTYGFFIPMMFRSGSVLVEEMKTKEQTPLICILERIVYTLHTLANFSCHWNNKDKQGDWWLMKVLVSCD